MTTLVSSNAHWNGLTWNIRDGVKRVTVDQIFAAANSETFESTPMKRLVIEGGLEDSEFLVLLSTLSSSFRGDVLFIDRADRAFRSAMADDGRRVLYTLSAEDIEFYVDVNGLRQGTNELHRAERSPIGHAVRVLVAEDDARTLKALLMILSDLGCEAIVARSRPEALRMSVERRPDVLLLDGLMPHMNGFEVARFVRSIDSNYRPRIIIATGLYKNTRHGADARLKYGVDGYLVKPVTLEQIASAIFGEQMPQENELAAAS